MASAYLVTHMSISDHYNVVQQALPKHHDQHLGTIVPYFLTSPKSFTLTPEGGKGEFGS